MELQEVLTELRSLGRSGNVEGMKRFGINSRTALGISIPILRNLARQIRKDHLLALALWNTNIHEARLLAIFIADVKLLTEEQMEAWVGDFDSWDICDQACSLFAKHPLAYQKVFEWAEREEEFQKRASFSLIATLAVHDKKADDLKFIQFLPLIELKANDARNFVKKAVNWALRQVGKRNASLMQVASETAGRIHAQGSSSAKWIASDALREFNKKSSSLYL